VQDLELLYKGYRDGYGPGFNRDDGPPLVVVIRAGTIRHLPGLAPGGPAGFTWGYGQISNGLLLCKVV